MSENLPNSVRYVKNGKGGRWWQSAKTNAQIHLGWKEIPHELLRNPDFPAIEKLNRRGFTDQGAATRDYNALRWLLDNPSQHVWITFEDGCMWWCTVRDRVHPNPRGQDQDNGHFWLACDRPWSNHSLRGRLLAISDLPGGVTATANFQGTVCKPDASEAILRIIRDEMDQDVVALVDVRGRYEQAIYKIINRLVWQDFEQLIDLILARTGWMRISTLGGTREGIDIEVENQTTNEIAFVQVKSSAGQAVLDDYVRRFEAQRERYARMIFAVHSPNSRLTPPAHLPVQLWTSQKLAPLVVRLGLGEWVENKL
jgi:hypothetical protein